MLTCFVLLAATLPAQFDMPAMPPAPVTGSPCLGEALELSFGDMLAPGAAAARLARERCIAEPELRAPLQGARAFSVPLGRMSLVRFHLFGEPVTFGLRLNLATAPTLYHDLGGPPGIRPLDELHVVPELRLPEAWEWALNDYVTTPVLLGASATVATAVLWSLAH